MCKAGGEGLAAGSVRCPQCHQATAASARFCGHCGAALSR